MKNYVKSKQQMISRRDGVIMKNLSFLILIFAFFSFLLHVSCRTIVNDVISDKETSSSIVPIVDREYFPVAKKLIRKAKKSISISMFVVKSGKKVDALIKELKNAANRGVKIKILLENSIRANRSLINSLNGIENIEIKFDSPEKITHNKMVIIDRNVILIGSTNWTESSLGYANEANVVIKNKEVVEYFQEYFDYLWQDSSKDIFPFKDFEGEIIPIIDRQYFDIVSRMMRKANKRIFVMVYGFKLTRNRDSKGDILAEEIVNARKRGIETKVMLEKSSFNERLNIMNRHTIEYFKERGVEARFDDEDIITHSKVVIIDDAVILGSTNWSYSGLEKWHNADVLIKDKRIVEYFVNYFEEKFSKGK